MPARVGFVGSPCMSSSSRRRSLGRIGGIPEPQLLFAPPLKGWPLRGGDRSGRVTGRLWRCGWVWSRNPARESGDNSLSELVLAAWHVLCYRGSVEERMTDEK